MSDFDLRREEYLTLRKEIETQMSELAQFERNCIFAAAVVYVWFVKDVAITSIAEAGWFIPILFALFGSLRSLSVGGHLSALGQYIYLIESAHLTEPKFAKGWQNFLKTPAQKRKVRTGFTILF